jgi:quinol monooxygenase YgiN
VSQEDEVEIFTVARFHALPGSEDAAAKAMREVHVGTVEEPGCLSHEVYCSIRDPGLFFIISRWKDEPAFEVHALLPHTLRFLERIEPLIDHEVEVIRTERIV